MSSSAHQLFNSLFEVLPHKQNSSEALYPCYSRQRPHTTNVHDNLQIFPLYISGACEASFIKVFKHNPTSAVLLLNPSSYILNANTVTSLGFGPTKTQCLLRSKSEN